MGTDIENLQELLKEDPSNFQARRELSVLLADNGFNEEALANLEYLIKYFPDDADLYYNLGILYEKIKNLKKAKESYEKAISIHPQTDFYYNLGEVLVNLEDWDNAIKAFEQVLKQDSNDSNAYFNLGVCYYNKDEIKTATDNFQYAINLNPKDVFAYFYLGNIYQQSGLTNFAEENYKKVLEISPDYSWAYFNLASIAYSNGNNDEAMRYLLKTIEFNDTDIESYKLLTKLCLKEDRVEEIITLLETRLKKEENGDLYYVLARVYKYIGDSENYAKNLRGALANHLTLTFDKEIIRLEYQKVADDEEHIEPERQIEEYEDIDSEDDYDEDSDEDDEESEEEEEEEEDDFDFEDDDLEEDEEDEEI